MPIFIWIIIGLLALIVIWLIALYNGLIRAKNRVDESWSDIDVQLKRRYNLIPNLVATVKGYAKHEKGVFEEVTKARTQAINSTGASEKAQSENMLSGALKTLFAVAENYPDLKASDSFINLQQELTDTENKIQAARRFYNGNVRDFNTKIQVFPNNLMASSLDFKNYDFFEVGDQQERAVVNVNF